MTPNQGWSKCSGGRSLTKGGQPLGAVFFPVFIGSAAQGGQPVIHPPFKGGICIIQLVTTHLGTSGGLTTSQEWSGLKSGQEGATA